MSKCNEKLSLIAYQYEFWKKKQVFSGKYSYSAELFQKLVAWWSDD